MIHRTLPYLQRQRGSFGDTWAERWHLLDAAFVADNTASIGHDKPVFAAIRELINAKFAFGPEETFYNGP
jgi:hypothetical protein